MLWIWHFHFKRWFFANGIVLAAMTEYWIKWLLCLQLHNWILAIFDAAVSYFIDFITKILMKECFLKISPKYIFSRSFYYYSSIILISVNHTWFCFKEMATLLHIVASHVLRSAPRHSQVKLFLTITKRSTWSMYTTWRQEWVVPLLRNLEEDLQETLCILCSLHHFRSEQSYMTNPFYMSGVASQFMQHILY